MDFLFFVKCSHTHNLTFTYLNQEFRLCARHTGVYGGFLVSSLYFLKSPMFFHWILYLDYLSFLLLELLLVTPVLIDWWLQCLAIRHSNNFTRLFTGILAGFALSLLVLNIKVVFITVPLAILWYAIFSRVGLYFRYHRSPEWGCKYCRRNVKKDEIYLVE